MANKQQKIAVGTILALIVMFTTSLWKSFVEFVGADGLATELGYAQYLHHSRIGIVLMLISAYILYFRKEKNWYLFAYILLIIGASLFIHHIATEQCFALWNPAGDYAGGIC